MAEEVREFLSETYGIDDDGLLTDVVDLSGLPQYAENNKANTASDAVYGSMQNMSDNELLNLMAHNLLTTEKMKNYIYLDKLGHITSGVGALLDDEDAFKSVPWMIGDRLATEKEVDDAYQMFTFKRFEKDSEGKFKNHNKLAESFEKECSLRISEEYMIQRMMTHLYDSTNDDTFKRGFSES